MISIMKALRALYVDMKVNYFINFVFINKRQNLWIQIFFSNIDFLFKHRIDLESPKNNQKVFLESLYCSMLTIVFL